MADDTDTRKPYELLDSGMSVNGRMAHFGDKVMLTDASAESLEPYGSIRPWGENDHDLVDDERDLPGMLAYSGGRMQLAEARIAKRGKRKPAEESVAREQFADAVANRPGPDPVHAASAPEESEAPARRTRERGSRSGATEGGSEASTGRRS